MRQSLSYLYVLALALPVCCLTSQSASTQTTLQKSKLAQGWDKKTRELFYHTPQGSRIMPYSWFLALETAEGQTLFSDEANLVQYGFIASPYRGSLNSDGLPIGFALGPSSETPRQLEAALAPDPLKHDSRKNYVGLTCAACHTAEVTVRGTKRVLDGAPARLDFDRFFQDLAEAVRETLREPDRFERFAQRVVGDQSGTETAQLRLAFAAFEAALSGEAVMRRPTRQSGFGRVDALTQIVNSLSVRDQKIPLNLREVAAPVSYPPLWLTPQLEFVQWSPIAASPIARNGGQVLGVFGQANLAYSGVDAFRSTVLLRELFAIEKWVEKLEAPTWDERLFGAIDTSLADRGKTLFLENCATCHNAAPYKKTNPADNFFGKTFIKIGKVDYKNVGTDPTYIEALTQRYVQTNDVTKKIFNDAAVVPAPAYFLRTVGAVLTKAMDDAAIPDTERAAMNGFRLRKGPNGRPIPYTPTSLRDLKASPLSAVWATGPYLHNGSVPTIYELLSPENERRKVFWTGAQELDLEKLGFISTDAPGRFRFDTTLKGNSNRGHNYPSGGLTHDQRMEIIEYLKTQ